MKKRLFLIGFVFFIFINLTLVLSVSYIGGNWTIEHEELHNYEYNIWTDYDTDTGEIIDVWEEEVIDECIDDPECKCVDDPECSLFTYPYVSVTQSDGNLEGIAIWPNFCYNGLVLLKLKGTISEDNHVKFTITFPSGEEQCPPYIDGIGLWKPYFRYSEEIKQYEGIYNSASRTINGTYVGNQDSLYQEWWAYDNWGLYYHYSIDSKKISYSGMFTAELSNSSPVLLVYGWHGSPKNWNVLKPWLEIDGFATEILYYDDSQSAVIASAALSQKVNEMLEKYGSDKVDIIAHSYGGLVSRYYIEKAGGKKNVRNLVMIATPNHGSRLADYLTGELKDEKAKNIAEFILEFYGMFRPDSRWGSTLDLRTINNNFLDILNIGFDYGKIKVDTKYFVIAGTGHYPKKFSSHSMFLPGHDDGVVALSSASLQSKGVPLYCFELDHSSTVNPHNVLDRSYSEQLARVSLLRDAYVDVITKILEGSLPSSSVAPCPTGNDEDDSQWLPNLLEHLIVRMKSGESTADNFDVSSESTIEVGITFSFSDFNFTLTTPSGLKITPEVAAQNPDIDYIKNDNHWYYLINNPERGTWNYNVSAIEIPTEGENVGIFVIGDGNVSLQGDVNGDCQVNIFDLAAVGLCYGCSSGQACWQNCEQADVKPDGVINIFDLATVGLNYGKTC